MHVQQLDSWHARHDGVNVGDGERAFSAVTGGALILLGLHRRGLPGVVAALSGVALIHRGSTGHCSIYDRLGVDTAHKGSATPHDYFERGIHVEESVTIQRPLPELFDFWRNLANIPEFMCHVKKVQLTDPQHSHWVVHGPAGKDIEWDAEIINEEPGRLIAWRSLPGAEVDNAGSVHFREAPAGRGTELRVVMEYLPPAGKLGVTIAKLMGESPGQQIREDLRRLRQIMETGEAPTTTGQPHGRGRRGARVPRGGGMTALVEVASRLSAKTDQPARNFARSEPQRPPQEPQRRPGPEPIKQQVERFEGEGGASTTGPKIRPGIPQEEGDE